MGEASCIVGALGWEDVEDLMDDIVSLGSAARVNQISWYYWRARMKLQIQCWLCD